MRIALTIERLDLNRGGAEVATLRLIQQLAGRGHEIHLFTEGVAAELPRGVVVHLIPQPWPGVALRQWSFARQVARRLAAEKLDASVACGRAFSESIAWSQGGVHLATVEGAIRSYYYSPLRRRLRRLQEWCSVKSWAYRWLERRCLARRPPPAVIAVSEMVAHEYQKYYRLSPDRLRVAHYQIDLERFSAARAGLLRPAARAKLGLGADTLAILFVGQNFKRKGVRPLIETTARLLGKRKDFCVLIAGGYPRQTAPQRRLANRLGCGEYVRFLGPTSCVDELFAAADVFCLPTFYDTFGIVVLEAMACGLPVITSRFAGAAELIRHGANGFVLAASQDTEHFADWLEALFDSDLRARLGAAAAQTARRVCLDNPANEIALLVETFARSGGNPQPRGQDDPGHRSHHQDESGWRRSQPTGR